MNDSLRGVFSTDSGMLAIWEPHHFRMVTDYLSWELELTEDVDIARHIQEGALVPLNVGADGVFECDIRVEGPELPCTLSDREQRYLVTSSEPYLFISRDRVAISGLEYVGAAPGGKAAYLPLANGHWAVTIHLIDWNKEPGALSETGEPTSLALADFVVLINPADVGAQYRRAVCTFESPDHS